MTEAANGRIQIASAFAHLDPSQGLGTGITAGFSRIGMKGKVWTLFHQGMMYRFIRPDDGMPLPYLDVIFLAENPATSRVYYEGSYQEDSGGNPPTCASTDGIVPDAGVPIPQSKTCATCSHSDWLPNRGGKECQEHRRTAVLLLPSMHTHPKLEAPVLEPVFLKIPPASLRPFKAYGDSLIHRGAPPASVVTRISFNPTKQFEMVFRLQQVLTNEEAPLVLPLISDPQTQYLIGRSASVRVISDQTDPATRGNAPIATGLAGAFGAPPAKKRGRPRKEEKDEEVVVEHQPAPVARAPIAAVSAGGASAAPAPWEDADAELDQDTAKLLGRKMGDMLP